MAAPDSFGFTRSAAWRLAGAGAYLLAAGALLAAIEARGPRSSAAPPAATAPPAAPRRATLTLTSTYAVSRWTVELDGVAQLPDASTAQGWQGRVSLRSRSTEVFIHGEAADPLADGPCALRVAIDDGAAVRSQVLWGEGSVSARLAPLQAGAAGP